MLLSERVGVMSMILGYNPCAFVPGYWYGQNHFPCTLSILHLVKIKQKKSMSKERRKCALDSNVFCYICVRFTTPKERRKITDFIQSLSCLRWCEIRRLKQAIDPSWSLCIMSVHPESMDKREKNISLLGFLWYRESWKIILMIATSAVSTF